MDINTEIEKYGIIVIQSLQSKDKKTGEELEHDILQYKKYTSNDMFSEIKYVVSKNDFFECMNDIVNFARENNYIFTLHFETHGGDEGVYLTSGECITWEEFYNCLIPINEALCNTLLVIMSMCKGGAIVSYIDPTKRAPYLAFIGAFRDISSDEITRGFEAFYKDYNGIHDLSICLDKMNNELNPEEKTFWLMSQETVFNAALDPNRDPKAFKKMVIKNTKKIRKEENVSVRQMIRNATKKMEKDRKDNIDHFCFKDIWNKET